MSSSSLPFPHRIQSQADLLLWEDRIDQILGRLTLEQKVGQLHQIPLPNTGEEEVIKAGKLGTGIFAASAFAGNERDAGTSWEAAERYQRMALDAGGIPLLFGRDVIHGHLTVYPIPLGQAAAWNPGLVEASQQIAAREATADGLHWTFSPVADIGRDPRWGRVAEGYGEDPYLSSELTAAAVRGFQRGEYPILSCLKHFAAYGAAEGGRDYARAALGQHEMKEIYLPSFRRGIIEGAATVMAGFNEADGIPATGNRWLQREVLKEEWGFNGAIVSDWNAIEELICHGVAKDRREAARIAIETGIDIDMVSGCYSEHLPSLVRDGVVKEALVDDAVRRVLRLKFAMGLFDDPFRRPLRPSMIVDPESLALSRKFAGEICVLLKNENNVLPLKKSQPLFLTGPFVNARDELFGTWTCDGKHAWVTPVHQAFTEAWEGKITAQPFLDGVVESARSSGCAVALLGEHPIRSGEAHSVADIGLPPGQIEILRALALAKVPVVTVIFTGRPLALDEVSRLSDAVLIAWHPGTDGARAVVDILSGDKNPSGRLPASFPHVTGQIPVHYSQHKTGRPQTPPESRYLDAPYGAQYPFGYGLSYTTISCEDLRIEDHGGGSWTIRATAQNSGNSDTLATIQLYVRDLVGSRARPVRELKRFLKAEIPAGEKKEISWQLSEQDFAFSRANGTWGAEPGEFRIWVSTHSRDGVEGMLTLA